MRAPKDYQEALEVIDELTSDLENAEETIKDMEQSSMDSEKLSRVLEAVSRDIRIPDTERAPVKALHDLIENRPYSERLTQELVSWFRHELSQ